MSDIHLGGRAFNTEVVLGKLYSVFQFTPTAANIDIIFLAGDIFDCLQSWPDEPVGPIQLFISHLLKYCKKYDILLRVLEGTKSHDRKQSKEFIIINEMLQINADVRYITGVEIEHVDKFNIDILYVPDEHKPTTEETKEEVIKLMQERGLEFVDFSVMHGHFPHQVPDVKYLQVHDPDFYSYITKRYVFIGHDHEMCVHDNLIAHGSFDRTAHGQENPKGYFNVISHRDRSLDRVTFVENELATPFITVDVENLTYDDSKKAIDEVIIPILDYPESNIRIKYRRNDLIDAYYNSLVKVYPKINWSKLYVRDEPVVKTSTLVEIYKPVNITPNNVTSIIKKRLKCGDADDSLIKTALQLLHEIR